MRKSNLTAEQIYEKDKQRKRDYYKRNKEKLKEQNKNNYYSKMSDEEKLEKMKKIYLTMNNKKLILNLLEFDTPKKMNDIEITILTD